MTWYLVCTCSFLPPAAYNEAEHGEDTDIYNVISAKKKFCKEWVCCLSMYGRKVHKQWTLGKAALNGFNLSITERFLLHCTNAKQWVIVLNNTQVGLDLCHLIKKNTYQHKLIDCVVASTLWGRFDLLCITSAFKGLVSRSGCAVNAAKMHGLGRRLRNGAT